MAKPKMASVPKPSNSEAEMPPHCTLLKVKNWRRERDSNSRTFRSAVFKTAALNHSAIPPVVKNN